MLSNNSGDIVIQYVHEKFDELLKCEDIIDIAHIGNTANAMYQYESAKLVDIDMIIFVKQFRLFAGEFIHRLCSEIKQEVEQNYPDVLLNFAAIRGPYKPATLSISKKTIFIHLLIFTIDTYLDSSILFRYACRKYECYCNKTLLKDLYQDIGIDNLLYDCYYGAYKMLADIKLNYVEYACRNLPDLKETKLVIENPHPIFIEYCFFAATTLARNHARIQKHIQAETYPNSMFFDWYNNNVFQSEELIKIVNLKTMSRQEGYAIAITKAPPLVIDWIEKLLVVVSL